jgi:putative NADPH-quinone reductase
VAGADAVLWSFPCYFGRARKLKRFIELVFESGARVAFAGKYTAAISTSIHFFDTLRMHTFTLFATIWVCAT